LPFRFSKRLSTPFGRINIGTRGVSLTEGVRGAHITIGRTPRITLGIPGSGISWTETMEHGRRAPQGAPQPAQPRSGWVAALIVIGLLALLAIVGGGGHP
jgi:Protein of unknown function (DUF4236)